MLPKDLAQIRLAQQQIAGTSYRLPADLVSWMGAMQAQDYAMLKWAIGLRLKQATESTIEKALTEGPLIRLHLLRPTWHVVAAQDVHWMRELTAPQIKIATRSRHRELGITDELVAKSNRVIEAAFKNQALLSKEKLGSHLLAAGLDLDQNRLYHWLLRAEMAGLICGGPPSGRTLTFSLLEARVPTTPAIPREEALGRLARRYFQSHGPATLADFAWWSGLTKTDARRALESVQEAFVCEKVGAQAYWLSPDIPPLSIDPGQVFLLPAYDEYLISYQDRDAMLPEEPYQNLIARNGLFRPILVQGGKILGIWKRKLQKSHINVAITAFPPTKETIERSAVEKALMQMAEFWGKPCTLHHLS